MSAFVYASESRSSALWLGLYIRFTLTIVVAKTILYVYLFRHNARAHRKSWTIYLSNPVVKVIF